MPALSTPRQNAVILVVLLSSQLFLMAGSVKGAGGATFLETALMRVTSPAVSLAQAVGGSLRGLATGLRNLIAAHSHNATLETELERLVAEAVVLREAERENWRLRRLLGMRQELVPASIAASVVTSNLNGETRMLVVDRGRRDGVVPDLPVVAGGGAVGRVVMADKRHAKVRLLTDANSGVAGVVQRSRAQGIVLGRPEGRLEMLYVPRFSDVMTGDRVVTSGLDGIYPRGFNVGLVRSIDESPDGAQVLHLEPELDYRSLEEVLIVLEPPGGKLAAAEDEESP